MESTAGPLDWTNKQWDSLHNYRHNDPYYISKVHDKLFISGYEPAYDEAILMQHGTTHIVNMTPNTFEERSFEISVYLQVHVSDSFSERMYPHFNRIAIFIKAAHMNDGKVLVHCRAGVSRSATAVLAHLMVNEAYKLPLAWEVLRAARNIVRPNKTFVLEHTRELERPGAYRGTQVA
jgi:protein-tyrosine phosphatase